jgi:hypothetical protein
MSGRMDSACPSLMYAGPRLVTISLNCRARSTWLGEMEATLIRIEQTWVWGWDGAWWAVSHLVLLHLFEGDVERDGREEAAGHAQQLHDALQHRARPLGPVRRDGVGVVFLCTHPPAPCKLRESAAAYSDGKVSE